MEITNFSYLLFALLIFLFGVPLADDLSVLSGPLVRLLLSLCLLIIGVWSLKGSGRLFSVGMAFVIAGIICNVIAINFVSPVLVYSTYASLLGFLLIANWCTLNKLWWGRK